MRRRYPAPERWVSIGGNFLNSKLSQSLMDPDHGVRAVHSRDRGLLPWAAARSGSVNVLMMPNDYKIYHGVSYTPSQYVTRDVQRSPFVNTHMTHSYSNTMIISGCAIAGHNTANTALQAHVPPLSASYVGSYEHDERLSLLVAHLSSPPE